MFLKPPHHVVSLTRTAECRDTKPLRNDANVSASGV